MATLAAPYALRTATVGDVHAVARHRVAMFRDMGVLMESEGPALEASSAAFLARAIPAGQYHGWVAEHGGAVIAGAGVVLRPLLPRPGHLDGGVEAYVLNVYTDPPHRRRGVARALMDAVLDWCQSQAIARVTLHASDEGRPLYLTLGFASTNEMLRDLR
jgi:GNAT superfamily N-acetyltransferase